jgi:hypothetical protein
LKDRQIAQGDLVIAVNGQRADSGTLSSLLDLTSASPITVVTVVRPCPKHDLRADSSDHGDAAPTPSAAASAAEEERKTEEATSGAADDSTPGCTRRDACEPREQEDHAARSSPSDSAEPTDSSSLTYASTLADLARQQSELMAVMARARALLDSDDTVDELPEPPRGISQIPPSSPSAVVEGGSNAPPCVSADGCSSFGSKSYQAVPHPMPSRTCSETEACDQAPLLLLPTEEARRDRVSPEQKPPTSAPVIGTAAEKPAATASSKATCQAATPEVPAFEPLDAARGLWSDLPSGSEAAQTDGIPDPSAMYDPAKGVWCDTPTSRPPPSASPATAEDDARLTAPVGGSACVLS